MKLSRKCQYALRAIFELGQKAHTGPVASREIAAAQRIPSNFLELILKEMRQAGWVESVRGPNGGYALAVSPSDLSLGEVIRFIECPFSSVSCMAGSGGRHCAAQDRCAFAAVWDRAEMLLSGLYDKTTFQDVIDEQEVAGCPDRQVTAF